MVVINFSSISNYVLLYNHKYAVTNMLFKVVDNLKQNNHKLHFNY